MAGRITGAVFLGEGTLHIEPPSAMERRQLKAVMKNEVLDQHFTSAVFSFTDGTAAELKQAAKGTAAADGAAVPRAAESQKVFRQDLKYNLEARLLEDLVEPASQQSSTFFLAEVKAGTFAKRLIFFLDPNGAFAVAPEEVALLTSADFGFDTTLGFHSSANASRPATGGTFDIPQQSLDVTIDKDGKVTGRAITAVTAKKDLQVLPLDLAPTLRVSGAWGPGGEALDFIQEDKTKDAGLAIVLKKPLSAGQSLQITTQYAGKDAITDEGSNNYNLAARKDWYPNVRSELGNYAFYDITFHTGRDIEVIATGNKLSDKQDGKQRTSIWQTTTPIAVAGFSLGAFKSNQSERNKDLLVVSYANTDLADRYKAFEGGPAMGTMSTTGMLKRATSEGDAAIQIYTDLFGPLPYDHVFLTQQTACDYGQSWPMLVYLPICYFWDKTIQHQLGVRDADPTYWNVVTAHEVAHQWWGQTVGFDSYRDQWMSEGFANFSAAAFLLRTRGGDNKEYRDFWALLHKRLTEKNAQGVRPVDVGPVVMGTRANSSRTGGDVYQQLVYCKGAYILHSLEALYWSPKYGDTPFRQAMHDFVATYRNKPATTEDFKAVMERDMPPWIDADGNHRLDWFFNAYVYGAATPHYEVSSLFTKQGDDTVVHFKVTQSNVPDDFKMLVPLYLPVSDKVTTFLGRVLVTGDATVEQTLNLGKTPTAGKPLLVNYNFDLLSN